MLKNKLSIFLASALWPFLCTAFFDFPSKEIPRHKQRDLLLNWPEVSLNLPKNCPGSLSTAYLNDCQLQKLENLPDAHSFKSAFEKRALALSTAFYKTPGKVLKIPSLGRDPKGHKKEVAFLKEELTPLLDLALLFRVSKNKKLKERAFKRVKERVLLWAQNRPRPVDGHPGTLKPRGDTGLAIWTYASNFLIAWDLIRFDKRWSRKEVAGVQLWIKDLCEYHPEVQRKLDNKFNWQTYFLGLCGVVLGRGPFIKTSLKRASFARYVQISRQGPMFREVKRGHKGTTYTMMALNPLIQMGVLAYNHGAGEWNKGDHPYGHALRQATKFLHKSLLGPDNWCRFYCLGDLRLPQEAGDWGHFFLLPRALWGDVFLGVIDERTYIGPHLSKGYSLGPIGLLQEVF